jgi:hypothetical protein
MCGISPNKQAPSMPASDGRRQQDTVEAANLSLPQDRQSMRQQGFKQASIRCRAEDAGSLLEADIG